MQLVQRWVYLWSQWPLFISLFRFLYCYVCLLEEQPTQKSKTCFSSWLQMTALKLDYIKYSFWTHSSAQHQHLLFALKRTIEFKAWKVWIHNYSLWILYINETVFFTVSHLASLFTETLNDVDTVRQWIKLGSDWVFLAIGQEEVLCVIQRVSHLAKSHHNTSNNWQLF